MAKNLIQGLGFVVFLLIVLFFASDFREIMTAEEDLGLQYTLIAILFIIVIIELVYLIFRLVLLIREIIRKRKENAKNRQTK